MTDELLNINDLVFVNPEGGGARITAIPIKGYEINGTSSTYGSDPFDPRVRTVSN